MEEVIKKWELILQQDSGRDITYGRKVLEEMLTDVKTAVKNCSIPPVSVRSEQSNCVHCYEHILTVKTLKYKCKNCGDEKWEQLD